MSPTSSSKTNRSYLIVWLALLVLTLVTWLVSYVPLGMLNVTVAMIIASAKAALVALFFMHLKYENRLLWAFAIVPLGFLLLIIGGTLGDVLLR